MQLHFSNQYTKNSYFEIVNCELSLIAFILFFQNYDAIIVRSDTKITAEVLSAGAAGKLKVVGRAGVGIDNIDVEEATKNNVVVLK